MSKVRTRWSRFSFFLTYIILPDSNSDSEAEVTPHQESPTYPQSVTYEKTPSETDNDMSYSVSSELEKYTNVFNVYVESRRMWRHLLMYQVILMVLVYVESRRMWRHLLMYQVILMVLVYVESRRMWRHLLMYQVILMVLVMLAKQAANPGGMEIHPPIFDLHPSPPIILSFTHCPSLQWGEIFRGA